MNVLKVTNCYSWLYSDNEGLKELLWKRLRFRERDCFHNARYKMHLWDGYVDFFNKETGRFLTGLLPEIKLALYTLDVKYELVDERNEVEFITDKVDENFLEKYRPPNVMPMTLRDYQVDYINQTIHHKRGLVDSKTGSGKTAVMVGIVLALAPGTPTLILANRQDLVEQNYDELMRWGIPNVGRFYGKKHDANVITCATVQSAHLLKPLLPKIKALIVDEIHDLMSKKPRKIYQSLVNARVRVGLSATPFKFGEKDLVQKWEVKGFIGPVFLVQNTETGKLTINELQKRNVLSEDTCTFRPVRTRSLDFYTYMDAVQEGISENTDFHEMNARLIDKLDGRILVIVERIEHGDRLADMIPGSVWVRGQDTTETRKAIIERLKTDKDKVVAIATAGIFNTGINVYCHHLINSAGGQAEHVIEQRFGRGLRPADDKEQLHYHDWIFYNNDYLEKHSWKRATILTNAGRNVVVLEELDI